MNTRAIWAVLAAIGFVLLTWKRETVTATVSAAVAGWKGARNAGKYLPALHAAEDRYGVPRDLLARIAYQESRWRDDIVSGRFVSPAGALGLMQIVPRFHPTVDPLNVNAAIDYAARFLVQLKGRFGTWPLAVAAYNAGPGNVTKYGGIPPFRETQEYVAGVFQDVPGAARAV